MHLKLLSLAALAGASSAADGSNLVRDQQMAETETEVAKSPVPDLTSALSDPTIGCIMTLGNNDKPLSGCCPCADEGLCALLHCMNLETLSISDQCSCGQIEGACTDVGGLIDVASTMGLPLKEACEGVNACCEPEVTTNEAANTCMPAALEASGETAPNLSMIDTFVGGLSKKIRDLAASGTASCAEDKETPDEAPAGNGTTMDGNNTTTGGTNAPDEALAAPAGNGTTTDGNNTTTGGTNTPDEAPAGNGTTTDDNNTTTGGMNTPDEAPAAPAGNGTTMDGTNATDGTDYVADPSGNQEPEAGSGAGALVASAALLGSALTLFVI